MQNNNFKTENGKLFLLFLVVAMLILSLVFYVAWPYFTGKTIILSTQSSDPFDISQNSLNINYRINRIPIMEGAEDGNNIYVILHEENGTWEYEKASLVRPTGFFIKGEISSVLTNTIIVRYGIEKLQLKKDTDISKENITVEVRVSHSGEAEVLNVLQNGISVLKK